jgi:hypothetical protein
MHEISVIVASEADSRTICAALPGSLRVAGQSGWWVVPLSQGIAPDVVGDHFVIPDLEDSEKAAGLARIIGPLTDALCGLPLEQPIAQAFTQYFGGRGAQGAAVIKDRSRACARSFARAPPMKRLSYSPYEASPGVTRSTRSGSANGARWRS